MSKEQKKNLSDHRRRLEDLLLDDSFIRFIKDLAPEEESEYWQQWQHQHPDHRVLVEHAKELIQFTGNYEGRVPDPHFEVKKLEDSLNDDPINPKKYRDMNAIRMRRRTGSFWLATAAALVFVVVSVGLFLYMENVRDTDRHQEIATTSKSEYQTGFGEKAFLHLSDGSRIVLNANSHLTYSWSGSDKNGQDIDIQLEGEAWFDIEPFTGQTPRLFTVHTPDGIVEVTGTTFAVQTSPKGGTRTVLEKGEVRVRIPDSEDSAFTNNVILKPGEMAQLIPGSGRIELKEVNPEIYTSWIRDIWTFDRTPLTEVALRIETLFGVEVDIVCRELDEKTLSGAISSTNLTLIKEGLSQALQDEVRQEENRIRIGSSSGSCTEET